MTPIDVTSEDCLTLADVCRLSPPGRNGSKPHFSTILRWITRGAPSLDGRRVRLRAARFGGRWVTSRQALAEFVEALTPRLSDAAISPPRTPGQCVRASERASARLEKAGI
jgi:hypothetical protein